MQRRLAIERIEPPAPESDAVGKRRRVHWMELFFDLVFVAFIGQIAHGIHGDPGPAQFLTFLALFFPGWWAWMNMMLTVNLLPNLSPRGLGIALMFGMLAVGVMAAAAPAGLGERAWAFALGNAGLRLVLFGLWIYPLRTIGGLKWRIVVYNLVTAGLWVLSAAVPHPATFALWGIAIVIEMLLVTRGTRNTPGLTNALGIEHLAERLGLFVIIVLGESVLTLVTELDENWASDSAVAALAGFIVIALLSWSFFIYGTDTIEVGLDRLQAADDYSGLRDTVMYWPFLLVSGVTALAGALATAVEHAHEHLPLGSGVALGGGLALFYITNTFVSLRYGQPGRRVAVWAPPAILLPLGVIPLSQTIPATDSLFAVAVVQLLIIAIIQALAWQDRRKIATN